MRRHASAFLGPLLGALSLAGSTVALSAPAAAQTLQLVEIAKDLGQPTDLTSPPGDRRLFVTTASGQILLIENGVRVPQPFLDLAGIVNANQGLMSMAFHPDYATNGRFYVVYLDPNIEVALAEYTVSADRNVADPASGKVLIGPYGQVGPAHNWNCIRFGPDGMLYVATGDGGASHTSNFGQDLASLNGKILRLDVDLPAPYVPSDNPLVGTPGVREEIWAYGLRQPWRISFDRVTGDLYIAEVGASDWEEINVIPAGAAGPLNFGWRCLEGPDCTPFNCCSTVPFEDPIHTFDHTGGHCAIIGGELYRGQSMPALRGSYVFADFCSGDVWSLEYDGTSVTTFRDHTLEVSVGTTPLARPVTSISADSNGELYVIDRNGGNLYKVGPTGTDAYCGANLNSMGEAATLSVDSSVSVSANDFELEVQDVVPGSVGLFFYGEHRIRLPFGDGLRCVGGNTIRLHPPIAADASGSLARTYDLTQPPRPDAAVLPGDTWHFQLWYRDPAAGGAGFNLSNGVTATFQP